MKQTYFSKQHAGLVGIAVGIISLIACVINLTWASSSNIVKIVDSKVQEHSVADPDLAHPGFQRRYITNQQYYQDLSDIKGDLKAIKKYFDRSKK